MTRRRLLRLSRSLFVSALVASAAATVSHAGPNERGMLLVHDTGLVYTEEEGGPPGPSEAPACNLADDELPAGPPADGYGYVWKVYAAFPPGSSPRLKAVAFGAEFPPSVKVLAGGVPDEEFDFQLPAAGWPAVSGGGVQVSFLQLKTEEVAECYWLAGFGSSGRWALSRHPSQLNMFADDSIPPIEDQILGLGAIGFGQPGVTHCPGEVLFGACCYADGSCRLAEEPACVEGEGIFRGVDFTCSPDPCAAGACCLPSGQCFVVTRAECVLAGYYQGDLVPCDPYPCAPPCACCQEGSCFVTAPENCKRQGGTPYPEYAQCAPGLCPQPPPVGACCLPDGKCELLNQEDCDLAQGYWDPRDECGPSVCPGIVACCFPDGRCEDLEHYVCCGQSGVPLPAGTSCQTSTCPPPTGACCLLGGDCRIETEEECDGLWFAGALCTPNPCPQILGACCLEGGVCALTTEAGCAGVWLEFVDCDPNPCVGPDGACCLLSGNCVLLPESTCPGAWLGPEVACAPNPCLALPGACCFPTGECLVTTVQDCPAEWQGAGTGCEPNPCGGTETPGACCYSDGSCRIALEEDCTGNWQGAGTGCEPDPCPEPVGACCFPDGSCRMLGPAGCDGEGGSWLGLGFDCDPNPCPGPVPVEPTSWGRLKTIYRG